MIELLAFLNFFEIGRIKEVLCTGLINDSDKVEKTIIYNSKNGKLYEYDSFQEKFFLKEKNKPVTEDVFGIAGYAGTYNFESIFIGNNLKFMEKLSADVDLFGFPTQVETTEIIKIINAKNESSNYKAEYSLTGFNGLKNVDVKSDLNCKLIDTYSF